MSLMGKKLPGAAEWYGEYLGVSNCGDYDNNNGGILRFPDGTIWRWETEMGTWITDSLTIDALQFIEYRPGSKYWEHLSADWRIDHWYDYNTPETLPLGGDMRVSSFGYTYSSVWVVGHAGDDDLVYVFNYWGDEDDYRLLMFDKSTYQWKQYREAHNAAEAAAGKPLIPFSVPTFDQDYGYYITSYNYFNLGQVGVVRFRRGDPSDLAPVHFFPANSGEWERTMNPATGRINALNEDYLGTTSAASLLGSVHIVYHDSTFFLMHYASHPDPVSSENPTTSWFSIREWDGTSDQTKLLYYGFDPDAYGWGLSYGANGDRSTWIDEEAGLGSVPLKPVTSSEMRVRDGWLYWLDEAGYRSSQSIYFARINLDELRAQYALTGEPIQHEPLNPRFEILCNASASWESDAAWVENVGWQVLWREGDSPIYNTIDKNWFFDDDGAIVFAHEEFPAWATTYEATHWVISRLVPPEANNAKLSLVFEGQALKGYSGVRDAGSAWAPEEIVLR